MNLRYSTVITALSMALAGPAVAQSVGIATSNPGSIYHSSGAAIAKVANEKAGIRATIQPFASPNVYIPAVNTGEIEFGLANVYETSLAVEGKAHYKGRPNPDLRAVAIMYPLRVAVFVRKDSPIKSISQLKGKSMPDGYTSQKILLPILEAVYSTGGLSRADMRPVQVPNVVGGANDFIAGKVEGFLFAIGAGKVREANAAVKGIRMLPMANTPENLKRVKKFLPLAYFRPEKPSKRNVGVLEPTHSIAYDALVFAGAKTSDDLAYRLAKAMHANKKAMAATFGVFNLFNPKRMNPKIDPIKYHPGAVKFYKEIGAWPPK